MKRFTQLFFIVLISWFSVAQSSAAINNVPKDIIARVGDQTITLSQIDTMINSSSMVGLDIPAVGTAERDQARVTILDRVITANLLYLDARKKGLDNDPNYKKDVEQYAKSLLAITYKSKKLIGDIPVSDKEVREYYEKNIKKDTELNDDLKLAIESIIRKQKHKEKIVDARKTIRKGAKVNIYEKELRAANDTKREDGVIVAKVDGDNITWAEVKQVLAAPGAKNDINARIDQLDRYIDEFIMTEKALKLGYDKDPVYLARLNEYQKVHLINLHRKTLLTKFAPSKDELKTFYVQNKNKIIFPESRKIQMVVLKTKKQAQQLKKDIESGKITFFEAAKKHSIDPNAKKTLGEMGWVPKGTGFPELDNLTFSLKKDTLGGPVKTPAGWHLVKVLDVRNALYTNFDDEITRDRTKRMYMHKKMDAHVVDLRKNVFEVQVYEQALKK